MSFDDFNYESYNDHILLDQNLQTLSDKLRTQVGGFNPSQPNGQDQDQFQTLTEQRLRTGKIAKFEFGETDARTEKEIEDMAI